MYRHRFHLLQFVITFVMLTRCLSASESSLMPVDYLRDIKPVLKSRCYSCHGALKQESGLRLDSGELIRKGGDNGAVLVPKSSAGRLLERIRSQDLSVRMPPEGHALSTEQISKVAEWIEQGADFPKGDQPEADPRQHWAFQKPIRHDPPRDVSGQQVTSPIDAFIAHEQFKHDVHPQPPASKHVLLRRVSIDLVGLPPTRDELQAFLNDDSPDAYDKVVDRLLRSPEYGERWGRHWMDVWRYSDWYGRRHVPDVWNSAPQIWRWRDWIVNSLNSDKGYDQMVAEMLAGDEIVPEDDEAGYATGYLIRNWYALNPNDWMRSNVEHTGKAFLGLTFNCAHCHDHKYDPISQEDYFRMRAFFEPISIRQDRVAGEADPGPFQEYNYSTLRKIVRLGAVRIFDKTPDAPTWFYTGGDERNRVSSRGTMAPGVPAFLANSPVNVQPVSLPPTAWYPGLRPAIQQSMLAEQRSAIQKLDTEQTAARMAADAALPDLQAKLDHAETEFSRARADATLVHQQMALSGSQSLLLDATAGRRIIHQGLQTLKSLPDKSIIRFQIQIVKDAHVNFQLAKDVFKGLTAGCIMFETGRIRSYRPNSFEEFEVGQYAFASGQNRFEVSLELQDKEDRCLLTVRSMADNKTLVDKIPVARNGWTPVGDFTKGVSFDARTGSIAAFDDLIVWSPAPADAAPDNSASPSSRLACFDFELPHYKLGNDVNGVDGWLLSSFSQAPATSTISATIGNEPLEVMARKVSAARRAIEVHLLKVKSLDARRIAAEVELSAIGSRIAADTARFGQIPTPDSEQLIQTARQLGLKSALCAAEADVLAKEQLLAVSDSKPADDPKRTPEIDAATKQVTAAYEALQKARASLENPSTVSTDAALGPQYPQSSTGRRKGLAQWITSRQNPLTARVAVNHIWLRHFHAPLVSTVYDFGRNGSHPTHPALLDWLAVELMDSGWSMKHLHRLIVTSDVYRIAAATRISEQPSHAVDPENRFYWRRNPGRMEAEVLRDSLLDIAGELDVQLGGQEFENNQALTTFRRTLYYSCHPELDGKSSMGTLFDAPEPADCYRRTSSIIPQQSLALTNSDLIHQVSGKVAGTVWHSLSVEQKSTPIEFIIRIYEHVLTRPPTDAEQQICKKFLSSFGQDESEQVKARESLVRALFNHNDFIAIR